MTSRRLKPRHHADRRRQGYLDSSTPAKTSGASPTISRAKAMSSARRKGKRLRIVFENIVLKDTAATAQCATNLGYQSMALAHPSLMARS